MKSFLNKGLKVILTGLVVSMPTLLAVHLVRAVTLPARVGELHTQTGAKALVQRSLAGFGSGLMKVATVRGSAPVSLVTGVLYTKGQAKIDWNGTTIPLQNGSYAYVGGEVIDMAPNAIGLLKLADGSSVYVCPGSRIQLSRSSGGQYSLSLMRGGSRFSFRADKNFQVKVNDVVVSRGLQTNATGAGDFVTAEVHAKKKKGCVICGLKSKLKVVTPTPAGGQSVAASTAGEILDVSTADQSTSATLEKTPIPAQIMSGLNSAVGSSGGSAAGGGYLCRCKEVQRYAKDLARAQQAIAKADGKTKAAALLAIAQAEAKAKVEALAITQAPVPNPAVEAITPTSEPAAVEQTAKLPDSVPQSTPVEPPATAPAPIPTPAAPPFVAELVVPLPEPAPPVAPPEAPPLALAVPGAPDPFDPNVLPPPAAGEPDEPVVLVVAPPVVPIAGSGGGAAASPS